MYVDFISCLYNLGRNDLLNDIFYQLGPETLHSAISVSRQWRDIIKDGLGGHSGVFRSQLRVNKRLQRLCRFYGLNPVEGTHKDIERLWRKELAKR